MAPWKGEGVGRAPSFIPNLFPVLSLPQDSISTAEEVSVYIAGAHITREFQCLVDDSEQCLSTAFCPALGAGSALGAGPTPNLLPPSAKASPAQGKSSFPSLPWRVSQRPQQLHPLLALSLLRLFGGWAHRKDPSPKQG